VGGDSGYSPIASATTPRKYLSARLVVQFGGFAAKLNNQYDYDFYILP